MSAPLIGVLDIQGAVTEHIDAFQACGATTQRVRRPSDLHSLCLLYTSPSPRD